MTPNELVRLLALIGAHLPSVLSARFVGVLPTELKNMVSLQVEPVRHLEREQLSVVEQALLSDLDALFDDEGAAEREILPLRVADVMALVLRQATISRSADVIRRLPDDLQSEILHLLAAQSWAAWERRLGTGELQVMVALKDALGLPHFEVSPQFVAEILHQIQTPQDVRRNLTYMYEKEPDSTGYIQNYLYGFESLVKLPDRELQVVLQGVDHWDLILAMRAIPANVRRKILSNLSQRRTKMFEDDEATLENVDDAQVEMLQHQILDRARLLYEAGQIHTYLGSVVGQEGDVDLSAVSLGGGGEGKSLAGLEKKKAPSKYVAGLIAILAMIGMGFVFVNWFGQSQISIDATKSGKVLVSDEVEDGGEITRDEGRTVQRMGKNLGSAAVISGRALLMTGESVRSLNDSEIKMGDRIKTDSDGRASVVLTGDVGQMQVEPDTDVQVGQVDSSEPGAPQLDLRVGNIWVKVKDPALEVRSPLAQITASEGALYHLRITLNATTTLSVHGGTVWIQASNGGGLHVLGLGERLRIDPDGDIDRDRHVEISKWQGNDE
jgi:flagellar motor switch protein FliG